ncbi:uncharacterized protein BX664DRAFT_55718 [Halteromyces radiatus]|uniref:uncharacterized protein n=1 Tax=Halteromyces radiatus TaxID=101107 RepID=UPI002220618F|nr:uncharacterized protein BX664DRAFT_55718 [Halteromyces radiatus]KAI8096275.1 hypothetical protein BX664DRAFT_55718 [Halteromyces radiatus]
MTQSSPPCQTMVDGSDEGDDQQYNDETILSCVQCHKPATFMCSSCGLIGPRYCSPQCQKQDWKTTHYKTCKSISARLSQSIPSNTELITTTTTTMMDQHSTATTNPFQDQGTMIDSDIPMQDMNPQQQQQGENITNDTEEFADNLKFYMQQIYLIIKPVVVCIVLSIFWVKVGFNDQSDYSPTRPTYNVLSSNNAASSNSGGGSSNSGSVGLSSLANAAIIIGQIILVTIIIVFFFRKGWIKVRN